MLSFERVKHRQLISIYRRMSLANNSPFRKSHFSLSIQALPYCKLQLMLVLLLESYRSYKEQLQEHLTCQWNIRGTKALLKVLKNQYQILPQGMSVYPPKTYWPFCMMVTVFLLPSHLSWKVLTFQPWDGSTVAKKPGRVHPNLRSASKKTVKMPEIILISM